MSQKNQNTGVLEAPFANKLILPLLASVGEWRKMEVEETGALSHWSYLEELTLLYFAVVTKKRFRVQSSPSTKDVNSKVSSLSKEQKPSLKVDIDFREEQKFLIWLMDTQWLVANGIILRRVAESFFKEEI